MFKKITFNFILFIIFLICINLQGQNVKVVYNFVTPLKANVKEDLFIKGEYALGIRDSIFNYENSERVSNINGGVSIRSTAKMNKEYYYRTIKDSKIIIKSTLSFKTYFIIDTPPTIEWNTNHSDIKDIKGYKCKKATANFRGSKIIAYYATAIPHPFGPYKFGGLPGLILELQEENKEINSWTADFIDLKSENDVAFTFPENSNKMISYEEFINLISNLNKQSVKNLASKVTTMTIASEIKTVRKGIEKTYEWE